MVLHFIVTLEKTKLINEIKKLTRSDFHTNKRWRRVSRDSVPKADILQGPTNEQHGNEQRPQPQFGLSAIFGYI